MSSSTTTFLYGTNGTFVAGEVLKKNTAGGSTYATIANTGSVNDVRTYGFGDIKQYAFNANGTADALLDVKVALPGSGPILSGHSGGSATITSTLSNFRSQLRVGDIVEFSNNGASHKATVTAAVSYTHLTLPTKRIV